jgi:hypothetical protein
MQLGAGDKKSSSPFVHYPVENATTLIAAQGDGGAARLRLLPALPSQGAESNVAATPK